MTILTGGSVTSSDIPPDIQRMAKRLQALHGTTMVTRESGGFHINVACPHCLEIDRRRELDKRHLAITLTMLNS
jgi:hypothetical protein